MYNAGYSITVMEYPALYICHLHIGEWVFFVCKLSQTNSVRSLFKIMSQKKQWNSQKQNEKLPVLGIKLAVMPTNLIQQFNKCQQKFSIFPLAFDDKHDCY